MIDIELSWPHPEPESGDSHAAAHRFIASRGTPGGDRPLFAIAACHGGALIRVRAVDPVLQGSLTKSDGYLRTIDHPLTFLDMRFRFVLTANAAEHRTGARVEPVVGETAAVAWLGRKAQAGGFEVDAEPLVLPSLAVPRRSGPAARLHRVRFAGTLRIVDAPTFSKALSGGIGRGKAFGLGMLILLSEDH